ncbi:MAG: DUF4351 domain-containing protein [Thermosynechococcaceae cyanobacterium]
MISEALDRQVRGLSVVQLEDLEEALLDCSGQVELVAWLTQIE